MMNNGDDEPNNQFFSTPINNTSHNNHVNQAREVMQNDFDSNNIEDISLKGKRGHFPAEHIPVVKLQVGDWMWTRTGADSQQPKLAIFYSKKVMYIELSIQGTRARFIIDWAKIEHILLRRGHTGQSMLIVVAPGEPQVQRALARTESQKTAWGQLQNFLEGHVADSKAYFRVESNEGELEPRHAKMLATYQDLKERQCVPRRLPPLWELPNDLLQELQRQLWKQVGFQPQLQQEPNHSTQPVQLPQNVPPQSRQPPQMLLPSGQSHNIPSQFQQPPNVQMHQRQVLQQNNNTSSIQSTLVQGTPSYAYEQTSQRRDSYLPDPKRRRVSGPADSTSYQRPTSEASHGYTHPRYYNREAAPQMCGQTNQDPLQTCIQEPGQGSFASTATLNQNLHANCNGGQMRPIMSMPTPTFSTDHMHTGGNIPTPQSSTRNNDYSSFNAAANHTLQMRPNVRMQTSPFLGDHMQHSGANIKTSQSTTENNACLSQQVQRETPPANNTSSSSNGAQVADGNQPNPDMSCQRKQTQVRLDLLESQLSAMESAIRSLLMMVNQQSQNSASQLPGKDTSSNAEADSTMPPQTQEPTILVGNTCNPYLGGIEQECPQVNNETTSLSDHMDSGLNPEEPTSLDVGNTSTLSLTNIEPQPLPVNITSPAICEASYAVEILNPACVSETSSRSELEYYFDPFERLMEDANVYNYVDAPTENEGNPVLQENSSDVMYTYEELLQELDSV